jgi:hypothetical protein
MGLTVTLLAEDVGIQTEDGFAVLIRKGTKLAGHIEHTQVFSTCKPASTNWARGIS